MNAIYTTDSAGRVQGVMSLRDLLAAPEGAKVSDIAWQEVKTVPLTADREEVARLTREYDLVAVPVDIGEGELGSGMGLLPSGDGPGPHGP